MLNKEAIQRVQSAYSKGIQSSDSRLSPRHIFNVLCTNRAKFLTQEHKKGQRISQWAYQVIPCAQIIEVDLEGCCNLLRTEHKIPPPLVGRDKHLITVTGQDGTLTFNETTWTNRKFKKGNKYTSETPDFFIRDSYIYLTELVLLGEITIEGLFSNPIEVYSFPVCGNEQLSCINNMDLPFPFEDDLMDGLIEVASNELIAKFNSVREDITNNGQDSLLNETK